MESQSLHQDIIDYFEVFLREKIGQRLIKNLTGFSSLFVITFKDVSLGPWTFMIEDGILLSLSQNDNPEKPRCKYVVTTEAFRKIIACTMSPQAGFFKGYVNIKRDIKHGLKLASLMEIFFKENQYGGE